MKEAKDGKSLQDNPSKSVHMGTITSVPHEISSYVHVIKTFKYECLI